MLVLSESSLAFVSRKGEDLVTVKTPAFAESVTEGDVRWEKGWFFLGGYFKEL